MFVLPPSVVPATLQNSFQGVVKFFLGLAVNAETALRTVRDKVLAEEVADKALFNDIAWGWRLHPDAQWERVLP